MHGWLQCLMESDHFSTDYPGVQSGEEDAVRGISPTGGTVYTTGTLMDEQFQSDHMEATVHNKSWHST